ncbi:hypothetical protein SS7213T_00109, partial [Staphylococcus simiae CCM 7213 = CCUG 51256]
LVLHEKTSYPVFLCWGPALHVRVSAILIARKSYEP